MPSIRTLIPVAAIAMACSPAYGKRMPAPAKDPILPLAESPYSVDLIGERGQALETYSHRGRFYVLGDSGERYSVRVHNPTSSRIEAVISIDGLDVVDGETANLTKRGYVIPAHGTVDIEGFRTSTRDVAAFRFSSVSNSYAGKKGKARNVGVIGVAIFAERNSDPVLIVPDRVTRRGDRDYRYDYEDDLDYGGEAEATSAPRPGPPRSRPSDKSAAADRPAEPPSPMGGSAGAIRPRHVPNTETVQKQKKERSGLGTAFGEQRYSAVSFTRFVRASGTPTAMAELRYNNADGLVALGIPVRQPVDADELATRETADPFPDSPRRFSLPPPY